MRALLGFVLLSCVGLAGCAATAAPAALSIRVLHSETPNVQATEVEQPQSDEAPPQNDSSPPLGAPRIGAPGGMGAGSRSVVPAQSGNDTVGGLPAGTAGGSGPAGRVG